jgi:Domain of unknown function (DUF5666)
MKKTIFFTLSVLLLLALALAFYVPGGLAAGRANSSSRAALVNATSTVDDNPTQQESPTQTETEKHNGQDDTQPTLEATPEAVEHGIETEDANHESAEAVEADEAEFTGTVQSMGSDSWMIGGKTVLVSAGTEIDSMIAIGDQVKVEGSVNADGKLVAREIKKFEASADSSNIKNSSDDPAGDNSSSGATSNPPSTSEDHSGKGQGSDDGGGHH